MVWGVEWLVNGIGRRLEESKVGDNSRVDGERCKRG